MCTCQAPEIPAGMAHPTRTFKLRCHDDRTNEGAKERTDGRTNERASERANSGSGSGNHHISTTVPAAAAAAAAAAREPFGRPHTDSDVRASGSARPSGAAAHSACASFEMSSADGRAQCQAFSITCASAPACGRVSVMCASASARMCVRMCVRVRVQVRVCARARTNPRCSYSTDRVMLCMSEDTHDCMWHHSRVSNVLDAKCNTSPYVIVGAVISSAASGNALQPIPTPPSQVRYP